MNGTMFTTNEHGLEILAFDADGVLVGALTAEPEGEQIRIEATFDDRYATIEVTQDAPDENAVQTDLNQADVVGRVAEMFSFAFAGSSAGPFAASKKECMWAFASIAAICGSAALFPIPVGALEVGGCLMGLGAALCECGQYLPINICP